jgi:hypothetical protein
MKVLEQTSDQHGPALFTVEETAGLIGMDPQLLRNWIAKGVIEPELPGGKNKNHLLSALQCLRLAFAKTFYEVNEDSFDDLKLGLRDLKEDMDSWQTWADFARPKTPTEEEEAERKRSLNFDADELEARREWRRTVRRASDRLKLAYCRGCEKVREVYLKIMALVANPDRGGGWTDRLEPAGINYREQQVTAHLVPKQPKRTRR